MNKKVSGLVNTIYKEKISNFCCINKNYKKLYVKLFLKNIKN